MAKKLTTKQIIEIAKRYSEITAEENKLKKEKAELREKLQKVMKDKNVNELLVDIYKITYSEYQTEQFDKARFKEEHNKMYGKYIYYTESSKVTVK